jgi:hypothetical protein
VVGAKPLLFPGYFVMAPLLERNKVNFREAGFILGIKNPGYFDFNPGRVGRPAQMGGMTLKEQVEAPQ